MQLTGGMQEARASARASSMKRRPQLISVFCGQGPRWERE
jgi:hypothetical protein